MRLFLRRRFFVVGDPSNSGTTSMKPSHISTSRYSQRVGFPNQQRIDTMCTKGEKDDDAFVLEIRVFSSKSVSIHQFAYICTDRCAIRGIHWLLALRLTVSHAELLYPLSWQASKHRPHQFFAFVIDTS